MIEQVWKSRAARRLAMLLALSTLPLLGSCSNDPGDRPSAAAIPLAPRGPDAGIAAAIRIQEAVSGGLLAKPGVVGTGIGLDARGEPAIVVLLERSETSGVPTSFGSFRVVREVVGPLRPFADAGRYRPVPIGVSSGNAIDCVAGTIGCVLEARGQHYLLSANHVFARQNQAAIGEVIAQPSLPDADPSCASSPPTNMVARLSDFEPVVYDGHTPNLMDAAIAALTTTNFTCATLPAFYGMPSSQPAEAVVGAGVLKVGRTTGQTRGSIKAIHLKVKITFPAGTALFVEQFLTSKDFGAFGDSGSLVVTDDDAHQPLGMLIGGGSNGTGIVTPLGPVLERFGATVCGK